MRRRQRERGQASVELVALVPLVLVVVLGVAQLLAGGLALELAGGAAEAGALALVRGEDARAAARDAVPGWSRSRVSVVVDGRTVRVRVRPARIVPGAAAMLETSVSADAGPRP